MKHVLAGCLALFLGLAPIAAQSDDKKPGTLAEQYRAILKEYQVGASGGDGTDEELKDIAVQCVTRHHAHHYLGFAETQWKLFEKENPPRVKPLLYVYRVLLTGIHLMQTGVVEGNLIRLIETEKLPYVEELIHRKVAGAEKERLTDADLSFHKREYDRLRNKLQEAHEASSLPEAARGSAALHDLLVRVRLSKN